MVHFVGAGPGAPDLITLRGAALLRTGGLVIYAGSLVNPALLGKTGPDAQIYNSAEMTLEEVLAGCAGREAGTEYGAPAHGRRQPVRRGARADGRAGRHGHRLRRYAGRVRFLRCGGGAEGGIHAARRQPDRYHDPHGGPYPVPEGERLAALAAHGATMVIFLSIGRIDRVQDALLQGAYTAATPAAVVYKATWPEEQVVHCTVGTLAAARARRASPRRRYCCRGLFGRTV